MLVTVRRYIDVHVRIYTYIYIMYVHMDVFTLPTVHIQYMTYGVIRQNSMYTCLYTVHVIINIMTLSLRK